MGATPTMNRSAKDGARSSPHYGGEGVTHSPIVPRCLLTARYGRLQRDPRRPVCVPASNRVSDPISGYAARRVSILQTWTYSPQKRQDGSAFALTYSLRLRSCKSMDAFIISSLPSLRWRHCKWQGPFAPRTLLRFLATPDPAATLSSSADFPVSPVIRPTLLRRFRAGTRRASPVAQHVLVTVPS